MFFIYLQCQNVAIEDVFMTGNVDVAITAIILETHPLDGVAFHRVGTITSWARDSSHTVKQLYDSWDIINGHSQCYKQQLTSLCVSLCVTGVMYVYVKGDKWIQ